MSSGYTPMNAAQRHALLKHARWLRDQYVAGRQISPEAMSWAQGVIRAHRVSTQEPK